MKIGLNKIKIFYILTTFAYIKSQFTQKKQLLKPIGSRGTKRTYGI